MKLEEKEKQKRSSYQKKHGRENCPEGIIVGILPLCRRYICRTAIGTLHFSLAQSILYWKEHKNPKILAYR